MEELCLLSRGRVWGSRLCRIYRVPEHPWYSLENLCWAQPKSREFLLFPGDFLPQVAWLLGGSQCFLATFIISRPYPFSYYHMVPGVISTIAKEDNLSAYGHGQFPWWGW
jgi:hypothetical protein